MILEEHMAGRQAGRRSSRPVKVLSTFRSLNGFIPTPKTRTTSLPLLAGSRSIIEPPGWLEWAAIAWPHSAGEWSCLRPPPRFPRRSAWIVPAFLRIASTSRVVLGGFFRHANHADGPRPIVHSGSCAQRRLRRIRLCSHRSSHRNHLPNGWKGWVEPLTQRIGKAMSSVMSGVSRSSRSRLMTKPLCGNFGAGP